MKKALITGITGQDGSYLAEFLLKKGYEVHGIKRRSSSFNTGRIDHLIEEDRNRFYLHYGDVTDASNILSLIKKIEPDEIYNLAAQSHVQVSFETPEYTASSVALGALRILEAVKILGLEKKMKFYQASTSELFGAVKEIPQSENTPFHPRSPYGVAKLYAHWITINYRESYNMFAVNGILFNHESPFRGETFVTRKITRAVARIVYGLQDTLYLGNLDAIRDWGHAQDYVRAMWLMLQNEYPEDFVIATGIPHTVREFVTAAFKVVDIDISWQDSGLNEKGVDLKTGRVLIAIHTRYFRPAEVNVLVGNAQKASEKLGWEPEISFDQLVSSMVKHDCRLVEKELVNSEKVQKDLKSKVL